MKEIWKPIPTYEGLYEVSNLGRVRTVPRTFISKQNRIITIERKIMKPYVNEHGYVVVGLTRNGKRKIKRVHVLMMLAFTKWDLERGYVNHKDGNKQNNVLDNLEWCTKAENNRHAAENGLRDYDKIRKGYHITIDDLDFEAKGAKTAAKRLHKEGYFTDVTVDNLKAAITNCAIKHYLYLGVLKAEKLDDRFDEPKEYHKCGIKGRRICAYVDGEQIIAKGPGKLADALQARGIGLDAKRDTLLKALSAAALSGNKCRGYVIEFLDD